MQIPAPESQVELLGSRPGTFYPPDAHSFNNERPTSPPGKRQTKTIENKYSTPRAGPIGLTKGERPALSSSRDENRPKRQPREIIKRIVTPTARQVRAWGKVNRINISSGGTNSSQSGMPLSARLRERGDSQGEALSSGRKDSERRELALTDFSGKYATRAKRYEAGKAEAIVAVGNMEKLDERADSEG